MAFVLLHERTEMTIRGCNSQVHDKMLIDPLHEAYRLNYFWGPQEGIFSRRDCVKCRHRLIYIRNGYGSI